MPPFDYNAPAELFLAKPSKGSRIAVSRQRLRLCAMPLRTCERPKPSARTWRSVMSTSTAAKSNACTNPLIIRYGSLSDRAFARPQRDDGAPSGRAFQNFDPRPQPSNTRSKAWALA